MLIAQNIVTFFSFLFKTYSVVTVILQLGAITVYLQLFFEKCFFLQNKYRLSAVTVLFDWLFVCFGISKLTIVYNLAWLFGRFLISSLFIGVISSCSYSNQKPPAGAHWLLLDKVSLSKTFHLPVGVVVRIVAQWNLFFKLCSLLPTNSISCLFHMRIFHHDIWLHL